MRLFNRVFAAAGELLKITVLGFKKTYIPNPSQSKGVLTIHINPEDYEKMTKIYVILKRKGTQQSIDYFKKKMALTQTEGNRGTAFDNSNEGPSFGGGDGNDDEWMMPLRSPSI
ncbi:hypothetical protein Pyn_35616 [Prunus yedoensis var. nudiflora]|uniref:Uncharacterized protein n=1 Tax=Prunus yedoensis var. nudiflora TaxID=2094558 RepID=A0A314UKT5_PRUYE|nr:hypothetical protein Pyn_35616 [Prunus yedoensis var. nudiflora]